ncbi:MAG: phage holin family protein [Ferruginibacter sp.]
MKYVYKILITTVNAFILAYLLPGISFQSIFTALIVAVVLAFLDAVIKPLLILLTLPVTILTLGLFLFVINACIILIADQVVNGFKVQSFWHAFLFSILLSFFNSFVHKRAFPDKAAEDKKNTINF